MLILVLNFFFFLFPAEPVEEVTLEQLQSKVIQSTNDTLYVVNFWATWCKPCVAELPYFEQAGETYKAQNVKVLLVSLDFLRDKQKVDKFVTDRSLKSEVVLLNAGNPNSWIDKIEPQWGGAIPATILYRKGEKVFFREGEFEQTELDSLIQTKLNKQ
ncbi:MAG: TlpA family protein disulfide reductase [Bacteroidia bacterium]